MEQSIEQKISLLEAQKTLLESTLMNEGSAALERFHPARVIKDTLAELYADHSVKQDLLRVSVHLASNYLINRFTPNKKSISGFLKMTILEEISGRLINMNLTNTPGED